MKFKKILTLFFTILFIIGFLFYKGFLRLNYPSFKEFPIQGIDISNHQGNIEWNEIDKTKVHFVYIKATEGGDFKDSKFQHNWKSAKSSNFPVGAYHFFTFCKSGKEQADNFINTVPIEKNSLPPVIDLEFGGNCKLNKSKQDVITEIEIFENLIYKTYNKKPILYVTEEFYNEFLIDNFLDNELWFRDVFKRPKIIGNRKWLIWQYANRAHLKGIKTYVDLNIFNGTENEFKELLK